MHKFIDFLAISYPYMQSFPIISNFVSSVQLRIEKKVLYLLLSSLVEEYHNNALQWKTMHRY